MRIGTIKPDTPAVSAAKRLTLHHLRRAAPNFEGPVNHGSDTRIWIICKGARDGRRDQQSRRFGRLIPNTEQLCGGLFGNRRGVD